MKRFKSKNEGEAWKNFVKAEKMYLDSRFKNNSLEFQEYIQTFGKPYYMVQDQAMPVRCSEEIMEPQRRLANHGIKVDKVDSSDRMLVWRDPKIRLERTSLTPVTAALVTNGRVLVQPDPMIRRERRSPTPYTVAMVINVGGRHNK